MIHRGLSWEWLQWLHGLDRRLYQLRDGSVRSRRSGPNRLLVEISRVLRVNAGRRCLGCCGNPLLKGWVGMRVVDGGWVEAAHRDRAWHDWGMAGARWIGSLRACHNGAC